MMLIFALMLAPAGAVSVPWDGLPEWSGRESDDRIIDRRLVMSALLEVLHLVYASIKAATLIRAPFPIVALIAPIQQILVITLPASQITEPSLWMPGDHSPLLRVSMLELGVLAGWVVVPVASTRIIHATMGRTQSNGEALEFHGT